MKPFDLEDLLEFLRRAEQLKDTLRSGHTARGRRESTAEHTWRLCLMAWLVHDHRPQLDLARLLKICLIHDLGEAVNGDVPAPEQTPGDPKAARERRDLLELVDCLPAHVRGELVALWDEYEAGSTPEGRMAKALDKLETVLQHTQGDNPADFDYRFNLGYGRQYTDADDLVAALRRPVDAETERRARGSEAATR